MLRNSATAGRLRRSGLREFWALDTFPFHIQKGINKRILYELAELDFIARGESLVFIGPPAVGKSGLASALLLKALYPGHRGLAIRSQYLFESMRSSHADRTTRAFFRRLACLDVLLIEEFGFLNLKFPPWGELQISREGSILVGGKAACGSGERGDEIPLRGQKGLGGGVRFISLR